MSKTLKSAKQSQNRSVDEAPFGDDVSPVALCKELYEKYRRVEYQSHDVQGVPLDRILEINPTRFIRKKTIAGWSKIKLRNFSRTNTINKTLPEGRNESIKT
ncbi:hypothetical protein ACROYT_G035285 [Oculina patagonica]